MNRLIRGIIFPCLLLSNLCWAAISPVSMLDNTANKIISKLSENQTRLKSNPKIIYNIISRYLLPQIDVSGMSRSVLGRRAWYRASKLERRQFSKAFTRLVIRTYAGAIADFNGDKVVFEPLRRRAQGKRFVRVKSQIIRPGGRKIPLDYNLVRKGGGWKIFDMSVEGVSLLQSFRSQFASELSRGSMSELLKRLASHNLHRVS